MLWSAIKNRHDAVFNETMESSLIPLIAGQQAFTGELEHWADAMGDDRLKGCLLEAAAEWQMSILATLLGNYRAAFRGLRLVLELSLQTVRLSVNLLDLLEWTSGRADTSWSVLVGEQGVFSKRFSDALWPDLHAYAGEYCEVARKCYRECSAYVHGNPVMIETGSGHIEFNAALVSTWCHLASDVSSVVSFAFVLRFVSQWRKVPMTMVSELEMRFGHIEVVRSRIQAASESEGVDGC